MPVPRCQARHMAAQFLVVPQWQGSASSRAMRLVDGADAISGDLPSSATHRVEIPAEAGEAQDTGIRRFSSIVVIAERMREVLAPLRGPVITIGGDCGVEFASIGDAAEKSGGDLAVVWLDAHPDANSPATSSSGAFTGMVLRSVVGDGIGALSATGDGRVDGSKVVVAGVREYDEGEAEYLGGIGASVVTADVFSPDAVVEAVAATGATNIYVHVDLDVLDPADVRGIDSPVPFGVRLAELVATITALRSRFSLAGAGITEFAPTSPTDAVDDLPTILRIVGSLTR